MLLQSKKILGTAAVLSLLALAGPALAQTATGASSTLYGGTTSATGASGTMTSTTPGAPNTGAGGDTTQNLVLLGLSGLVVVAGGAYLARKGATAR